MPSYDDVSPRISPVNSFHPRSETPDIIEPADYDPLSPARGFNLADELAMAEDSEHEDEEELFQGPPQNGNSLTQHNYEGSECSDIDDDTDIFISDHIDADEQQLNALIEDVIRENTNHNFIGQFVNDLRGMRGQLGVENHARRYCHHCP